MSSLFGKVHDFTEKYDPFGHALVDGAWKSSTKLVNESSRAMVKAGEKVGVNTDIPEYGLMTSEKDKGSVNRWGDNTVGVAGLLYGAGSGLESFGGEGAGAGAGGYSEAGGGFVGNGEFLGPHSGLSGYMNPQMFSQLGGMAGGGNKGQQGDGGAMARQQALAEYMRQQREQNEMAGELPGWVNMSGAY